jgi:outer membrane protein insertion porin family
MCKVNRAGLIALALTLLLPISTLAQTGTIEQIEVLGLYRMTSEAFLHAFGMKVGDSYDEGRLRQRYRALWELGLFEDIVIEKETGPQGGAVLVVKVKERPVLTSVTYEDNKVATRTNIEDRLKEREIGLDLGKPIDMRAIFFAESAIRDLLAEKGFLDAEVEASVRKVTETTRAVDFAITPGGKTRIRSIKFSGNSIFSDRKLAGELELTEKRKWYWPWSSKNLYHPVKWDQDVIKLRELYQNRGYLDIEIRPPIVEVKDASGKKDVPSDEGPVRAIEEPAELDLSGLTPERIEKLEKSRRKKERKKKAVKRWAELTVPVVEGEQYVMGDLSIVGNDVFPEELLRAMIPLKEGVMFRNNILESAVEAIRRMYEDRGHLYATVVRRIERREDEKVADVELFVEEDEPYYVARIEFSGNSKTHDRVLRREMLLTEGEMFSRTKLNISKMKVNQLGYFQVPDEPRIEPIEEEKRVNITFEGQEQGRNEIQIGGGYSGYEGAFFNGVYSTRNFLGRGQILSTAIQIGGRSDRYQISVQEPWFLGRPYRLGFSIYRRDIEYGFTLRSSSKGGGIVIGKRLRRFANIDLSYNWESVSSRSILASAAVVDDTDTDGPQTISSELKISSLTPVYFFSTINNPYRPTRGKSWRLSTQIAGGPLGGEVSFIKPIISFTGYKRAFRKTHFGFHARAGLVREWEDTGFLNRSSIFGIPRYHRFWLGGDTLGPRVFETRTITPLRYVILDDDGNILEVLGDPRLQPADDFVSSGGVPVPIEVGGDRFFLLQSEFVWPLNEQAELAFFVDVGDALFEDQSWGFETARVSAGVEVRFHLPIFPVPLRLIYGVPVRELEGDRSSNFTFSIGRSF